MRILAGRIIDSYCQIYKIRLTPVIDIWQWNTIIFDVWMFTGSIVTVYLPFHFVRVKLKWIIKNSTFNKFLYSTVNCNYYFRIDLWKSTYLSSTIEVVYFYSNTKLMHNTIRLNNVIVTWQLKLIVFDVWIFAGRIYYFILAVKINYCRRLNIWQWKGAIILENRNLAVKKFCIFYIRIFAGRIFDSEI